MACFFVPDIKNETVVCQSPCKHFDCAANRAEWANAKCRDCGKAFKAGDFFVFVPRLSDGDNVEHLCRDCAFKELEYART